MIVRKEKRDKKPGSVFGISGERLSGKTCWRASTRNRFDAAYAQAKPDKENRYSFRPAGRAHYRRWPRVVGLCAPFRRETA